MSSYLQNPLIRNTSNVMCEEKEGYCSHIPLRVQRPRHMLRHTIIQVWCASSCYHCGLANTVTAMRWAASGLAIVRLTWARVDAVPPTSLHYYLARQGKGWCNTRLEDWSFKFTVHLIPHYEATWSDVVGHTSGGPMKTCVWVTNFSLGAHDDKLHHLSWVIFRSPTAQYLMMNFGKSGNGVIQTIQNIT